MSNDTEFVAPVSKVLTVDGTSVTFTPLTMGEIPPVVRLVEPFLAELIYGADLMDAPKMVAMMGQHGEAVIQAVALAARQPLDWTEKRLPDRVCAMAMCAIEVNADFFSKALPMLEKLLPALAPSLVEKLQAKPPSGTPNASTS